MGEHSTNERRPNQLCATGAGWQRIRKQTGKILHSLFKLLYEHVLSCTDLNPQL